MTTKTCTNGHTMTGIGFDECPECEAPWIATPTVEEIVEEFAERFPCISNNCDNNGTLTVQDCDGEPAAEQCEYCHRQRFEDQAWFRTTLLAYGAEREAKGAEALKAVRYMLEVWDEVLPEGWRENPNHVQSIFLQVVDPTTHLTTQSEDNNKEV